MKYSLKNTHNKVDQLKFVCGGEFDETLSGSYNCRRQTIVTVCDFNMTLHQGVHNIVRDFRLVMLF
jgi:hypothetical protein